MKYRPVDVEAEAVARARTGAEPSAEAEAPDEEVEEEEVVVVVVVVAAAAVKGRCAAENAARTTSRGVPGRARLPFSRPPPEPRSPKGLFDPLW